MKFVGRLKSGLVGLVIGGVALGAASSKSKAGSVYSGGSSSAISYQAPQTTVTASPQALDEINLLVGDVTGFQNALDNPDIRKINIRGGQGPPFYPGSYFQGTFTVSDARGKPSITIDGNGVYLLGGLDISGQANVKLREFNISGAPDPFPPGSFSTNSGLESALINNHDSNDLRCYDCSFVAGSVVHNSSDDLMINNCEFLDDYKGDSKELDDLQAKDMNYLEIGELNAGRIYSINKSSFSGADNAIVIGGEDYQAGNKPRLKIFNNTFDNLKESGIVILDSLVNTQGGIINNAFSKTGGEAISGENYLGDEMDKEYNNYWDVGLGALSELETVVLNGNDSYVNPHFLNPQAGDFRPVVNDVNANWDMTKADYASGSEWFTSPDSVYKGKEPPIFSTPETAIPEPATSFLVLSALAGLGAYFRKRLAK
jgi:hypothetical protein